MSDPETVRLAEGIDDACITLRTASAELKGKPAIQIEVSDNGPGVPPEKEPKLFNRRFTTKRQGHGIGLVTVRKIIDAHQGQVGYSFDGGAVFTILLPVESQRSDNETEEVIAAAPAVVC